MKRRDAKHGDGGESASRFARRMKAPQIEREVLRCEFCGHTSPSRKDYGWVMGCDGAWYCSVECRAYIEGRVEELQ